LRRQRVDAGGEPAQQHLRGLRQLFVDQCECLCQALADDPFLPGERPLAGNADQDRDLFRHVSRAPAT
jgi:hypothetical protein